ncbi:MAG: RDD family protein [Spongiibacter sp.]|uniref:RDD family protein n=1 Tax=Spongiibacter thalassae TaxID=2721624 RepID=A0ABX1GF46_9GAMM|nr:RDD family protein [Spongiibacter thalassae]MDX1504132.1 RDD family protein [Spongiibacter sp.]NKI17824.1 RDD family protein [Spongiibacter thalassae]
MRTTEPTYASPWRRLAAIVYDGCLLFGVLFVASLIPALLMNTANLGQSPATDSVVHELNTPLHGAFYQAYLVALTVGFFGFFWRKNGQTLGMQAWRLKLETVDGGRISWPRCAARVVAAFVSLGLCGLGFFWIWIDKDRLSWHDRLCGTRLRVLPKAEKS